VAKGPKTLTPAERTALITAPFPPIGGSQRVQAYPWAGTIVADRFYEGFAERAQKGYIEPDHGSRLGADEAYEDLTILILGD